MSLDVRSRQTDGSRSLSLDEMFGTLLPEAIALNGELACRGLHYLDLPFLGLSVDGTDFTLAEASGKVTLTPGIESAGVVAVLDEDALSDLLQDVQSAMGLAMKSQTKITEGNITDWIAWEPVLRALLDGRKVHETGDVTFVDPDGGPLDLSRVFSVDGDPLEMGNFLEQAGFLHIRGVFDEDEMDALSRDVDEWISRATPEDGESWWATDGSGKQQAVRVLFFYEKSEVLRSLVADPRYQVVAGLTDDGHFHSGNAEGLVKPLGIVRGLSDLPWHKDCGQGMHSYMCNSLTTGISVTGADRTSGALGVIPGSHRANTMAAGRDRKLDLQPMLLETLTGDVTVHCSDTLHRAYPPVDRPRKVVYSSFTLPKRSSSAEEGKGSGIVDLEDREQAGGDEEAKRRARQQRAALSNVQDRIEAADNGENAKRYQAGHGR